MMILNNQKFNLQILNFKLKVVKEKNLKDLVKIIKMKIRYLSVILKFNKIEIFKQKMNVKKNSSNLKI